MRQESSDWRERSAAVGARLFRGTKNVRQLTVNFLVDVFCVGFVDVMRWFIGERLMIE